MRRPSILFICVRRVAENLPSWHCTLQHPRNHSAIERDVIILHLTSAQFNVRNSIYVFINLKTDHTSDLDNLLSIANSVINLFWSPDPSNPPPADKHLQGLVAKHGIKKDVGAFCYTFSILLNFASEEAIRERKEEVRGVTSSMLRILWEDTELVANATRTTYWQLNWAWMCLYFRARFHCTKEAVAEGLLPKLMELRDLIR